MGLCCRWVFKEVMKVNEAAWAGPDSVGLVSLYQEVIGTQTHREMTR